jgi:hypothetical protein
MAPFKDTELEKVKLLKQRIEKDGCLEEFQMIVKGNLNHKYSS